MVLDSDWVDLTTLLVMTTENFSSVIPTDLDYPFQLLWNYEL